jgi:hypothetical protein
MTSGLTDPVVTADLKRNRVDRMTPHNSTNKGFTDKENILGTTEKYL